jgi:glycosyltransferase involved in cell wall biosynthesis
MRPTICLCIVTKNEAHCIAKCIESVKPIISHWIICDDLETSDNSEQVIKETLKDIPGEYLRHQWIDMSTNRNQALELARQKAKYVLIIDADDLLVIEDIKEFDNLKENSYNINIKHNAISYYRPQLIKSTTPAKYIGVIHEYLELPDIGTDLKGSYIIYDGADPNPPYDPLKYVKHATTLEKALVIDPSNARNLFYCAQSWKDAGNIEKAITYYKKRIATIGWIEETYMALMELGKIYEITNPELVEETYLTAHNRYPIRAEALCHLAMYCRKNAQYEKAYFYASISRNILKPQHALFAEDACYSWAPLDEMAISGFYIGKVKEAGILNRRLLADHDVPEYHKPRIQANLEFCK